MRVAEFEFELPDALIAQHPPAQRGASRLLCLPRAGGVLRDVMFSDLGDLLRAGDLLVVNNTRVIKARLHGRKVTGGKVELLVERLLAHNRVLTQIRASKSPKPGSRIDVAGTGATVISRNGQFFEVEFDSSPLVLLEGHGHLPLPPYILRADTADDADRYQTVYASVDGAVAAPTAGLHFDDAVLARLIERGVCTAEITLHVGAGTFQPVRTEDVESHQIHPEWLQVDASVCEAVSRTKAAGGRVIAVGTTSVRALEAASAGLDLQPFEGDTSLFVYPGYRFRTVDAVLTNFHLPRSSLLMLVCAFAGTQNVLAAYRHAVRNQYRFYSYGDAMFIGSDSVATNHA